MKRDSLSSDGLSMGSPIVVSSLMKRYSAICLAIGAALLVAGCGARPEDAPAAPAATEGWVAGPRVDRVARSGTQLVVSGATAPLGRVVLTGADGVAYAANADNAGLFDVRIPVPTQTVLLAVEAQVGQIAYPGPYRLLIAAQADGPVALLGPGAPTRRLDTAGRLDAIDTDGRAVFLSGRAPPRTSVNVGPGEEGGVVADDEGRWTTLSGNVGAPVEVAGRVFVPPEMTATRDGVLERAGAGWRIAWTGVDGARQVTWFPDRGG